MAKIRYSIVAPCYNEEGNLFELHQSVLRLSVCHFHLLHRNYFYISIIDKSPQLKGILNNYPGLSPPHTKRLRNFPRNEEVPDEPEEQSVARNETILKEFCQMKHHILL